jgi:hypothetical protein
LRPLEPRHKIADAKPLFRKVEADGQELDEMLEKARKSLTKT